MAGLRFMQVGLNTCDMVGSLRFYSEVFGFTNSGAQSIWGDMMHLQGLPPSSRALLWWMVGRQEAIQLEFFHHTNPAQRPQPADWSPADHGWTRIGIGVSDLGRVLAALPAFGVQPFTDPLGAPGARRVAFRDPFAGFIVEVIEESDALPLPGRRRHFDFDPFIVYAAASVSDLAQARHFYSDVLGLPIGDANQLRRPEHEALWGLAGAASTSFLAEAGDVLLEIVEYSNPRGRPRRPDYRTSDQGIMNIGLRSADGAVVKRAIENVITGGHPCEAVVRNGDLLCSYSLGADREVEILACPPEADEASGFVPGVPHFGSLVGGDFLVLTPAEFLETR